MKLRTQTEIALWSISSYSFARDYVELPMYSLKSLVWISRLYTRAKKPTHTLPLFTINYNLRAKTLLSDKYLKIQNISILQHMLKQSQKIQIHLDFP